MSNPYRDEMKTTGAAKGRAMGVQNEFMPSRATKIANTPNSATAPPPPQQYQPQMPEDKTGPGYQNDAPSNWVRGMPSAEGKPGFDHSKKSG